MRGCCERDCNRLSSGGRCCRVFLLACAPPVVVASLLVSYLSVICYSHSFKARVPISLAPALSTLALFSAVVHCPSPPFSVAHSPVFLTLSPCSSCCCCSLAPFSLLGGGRTLLLARYPRHLPKYNGRAPRLSILRCCLLQFCCLPSLAIVISLHRCSAMSSPPGKPACAYVLYC